MKKNLMRKARVVSVPVVRERLTQVLHRQVAEKWTRNGART